MGLFCAKGFIAGRPERGIQSPCVQSRPAQRKGRHVSLPAPKEHLRFEYRERLDKIRDDERLVVAKLDRLGPDALDIGAMIRLLAARHIEVVVLQVGKLDLTSATEKMILCVLAAMAEVERDLLVERTQSGLARAKSEGKVLGRATKTTARDQAKIVELHADGQALLQIAVRFGIGKAIVKAARTAAHVPALTTPAKHAKATTKAAAAA